MFTNDLHTVLTAIQGCLEVLDPGQVKEFRGRAKQPTTVAVRNSARRLGLVNAFVDSQKRKADHGRIFILLCPRA